MKAEEALRITDAVEYAKVQRELHKIYVAVADFSARGYTAIKADITPDMSSRIEQIITTLKENGYKIKKEGRDLNIGWFKKDTP